MTSDIFAERQKTLIETFGGGYNRFLEGKKGVVLGIANENSIAYGCATVFHHFGAELAITYLNEKMEKYVRPLAHDVNCQIFAPCDVAVPGQLEAVFEDISRKWGAIDFALHSIAFAPKEDLHARVVDSSKDGFLMAMDTSCHSFIRMAKLCEPLMANGGSILTVTYYGSEKVVEHYNLMGPVKAALESAVRYLAAELGPKQIRVNSISPGPIMTRAASGIDHFDDLISRAIALSPERHLVSIEDVGFLAAFLVSNRSSRITGGIHYIDGGANIMG